MSNVVIQPITDESLVGRTADDIFEMYNKVAGTTSAILINGAVALGSYVIKEDDQVEIMTYKCH